MHKLATHLNSPSGHPYCLYGVPVYGLSDHLLCIFSTVDRGPLAPEMFDFKKKMDYYCRVTVKWGCFSEMAGKWAFVSMGPQ